jgi:hypothetical protein
VYIVPGRAGTRALGEYVSAGAMLDHAWDECLDAVKHAEEKDVLARFE